MCGTSQLITWNKCWRRKRQGGRGAVVRKRGEGRHRQQQTIESERKTKQNKTKQSINNTCEILWRKGRGQQQIQFVSAPHPKVHHSPRPKIRTLPPTRMPWAPLTQNPMHRGGPPPHHSATTPVQPRWVQHCEQPRRPSPPPPLICHPPLTDAVGVCGVWALAVYGVINSSGQSDQSMIR